jgi:hypothetical protein
MKDTAVKFLIDEISCRFIISEELRIAMYKAIEMEKEQHNETWDIAHQAGRFEGKGIAENNWQTFETHWNENFKSE